MATTHLNPVVRNGCRALVASLTLHVCLLGVMLVDAWRPFLVLLSKPAPTNLNQVVLQARTGPRSPEPETPVVRSESIDNRLTVDEVQQSPDRVFGDRTIAAVATASEEARSKSPEVNREQLEQLAGELGRISSEKSVDEIAGKFRQWLGTTTRAERPAEKLLAGEFDYATAQLHDVRREAAAEGGHVYFAILVDAEGRRFESRMEPVEGESAYKTMQLVKANPLAEMVYRRIVMGFLDNVIKASTTAQEMQESQAAQSPAAAGQPQP